nr:immunoglobulin light chain junction region [Macaca mulatta]
CQQYSDLFPWTF